ncbi:LysM peptidoglycan-binding domain-containing protein [Phototrophicus methaneseepsis]|uniref:LysM peptidoglycan-binding domain-containing protein n=1 Tax=Phototrophicus methaneseepsis TaxID=2710758 RepID=A0A7S8EA81_9CHLR|nr:LysM peptidoglycan-binding domain-containing protein [Phototrophicus methaneseepsis]QPC83195.1 LysM peptidoglycan-binding domain-containing protein [Phototrophicus methaneseepsis]
MRNVLRTSIALLALLTLFMSVSFAAAAQEGQLIHVVQPGENLYRISLRYGVSIGAIASANGISNVNLVYVGQQLVIPGGTGTPPTDEPPATEAPSGGVYTVQPGDTLSRIAARFGTTWSAIAAANNIANPNLIYPGQQLIIPGSSGTPPTTPTPAPGDGDSTPPPTNASFELGGHVFAFNMPQLMQDTGMTWAKRQLVWNGGGVDTAKAMIDDAHAKGFKVLLSVVGNPSQIAANPTQYYQDFANFLGEVAAAGADGIEVWNEPNIDREWPNGLVSGGAYTQMLRAAYQAIKSRNGNTLVISGAPTPTGFFGGCQAAGCDDNVFIQQMANAGAANYMDCVGIHYNAGITSPLVSSGAPVGSSGHYSWYYPRMVNLYAGTFPGKSLCFTELGYLTSEGYPALPDSYSWAAGTTLANQAEWLAQSVQSAKNSGRVRLLVVWNVDNTTYGDDPQAGYAIVRPNNSCPSCNAIRAVLQ